MKMSHRKLVCVLGFSHLCNLLSITLFISHAERNPPHDDDDESGMGTSIVTDEKSKSSSEVSTHLSESL